MIRFRDRRLFFSRTIIEFASEPDIPDFFQEKCDTVLSFNMFVDEDSHNYEPVPTWLFDFKDVKSASELFGLQSKTVRNSYSYCKKNGYHHVFLQGSEIRKNILKGFKQMCNEMYKNRGLKTRVSPRFLNEYIKNGYLALSYACKDREVFCYHVYAIDGIHARCWYSCSPIRANHDDQLLSKIKRFNLYSDIETFYSRGYKTYDFGGINSATNPDGRTKFKMGFSGKAVTLFQKPFSISKKAALYHKVAFLFHKLFR